MNLPGGNGWWGGTVGEFGIDMHTPLYLKWIINKDILYGTGNTVQCYTLITTNYWEKNLKKNIYMYIYIYVYICESLCSTPATNTTLLINYIPT